MNDNDGALAVMIIGQSGGGFASGSDPLEAVVIGLAAGRKLFHVLSYAPIHRWYR